MAQQCMRVAAAEFHELRGLCRELGDTPCKRSGERGIMELVNESH